MAMSIFSFLFSTERYQMFPQIACLGEAKLVTFVQRFSNNCKNDLYEKMHSHIEYIAIAIA